MGPKGLKDDDGSRVSRPVMGLLVVASLTVMTLDARGGDHSPLDPLRSAAGTVVGPVEAGTASAVRPFGDLAGFTHSNHQLRSEITRLRSANSKLRSQVETQPLDRQRLASLEGLTSTASQTGYSLVAARVVAMGPMQSFTRTVTIDAGTSSGVHADMTVLNNDGLVGRVIRANRTTATVLLVVDSGSVVGGRLGSNQEVGFLRGRGDSGSRGRLDLDLMDDSVTPAAGDTVVTWGSQGGVPYVAGIPIGRVVSVFSSPRQLAKHAVIEPFVDFTALDVVGVVVPRGTEGDRTVIGAEGKVR